MLKDKLASEEIGAEGHDVEMHLKRASSRYDEEAEVTVSKNYESDKLVSRARMEPTIQRTESHVWLDPKPKDPPFPVAEITRGASNPKPPYNLCSCSLGVLGGRWTWYGGS